ncbi:MAG: type II toxin-antitoxin system death-on-curing family toxin [Candidatus Micrarchaeia archaeon]
MESDVAYPSVERIVEFNFLVLTLIKVKKADSHRVLSYPKIMEAVEECQNAEGDIYKKAAALLEALVKKHAFASGNRRTAFIAAKSFVLSNGGKFKIVDDPNYARVMQGVREDYYSNEEIMEWIKHGKIREFKRSL